jgi:flagellar hook-associated protein 2
MATLNPINLDSLISGFNSSQGINVQQAVSEALAALAQPEVQWQNQQATLQSQTSALNQIESDVNALETSLTAIGDPAGAMSAMTTSSSNQNIVTATAANGAQSGNHVVVVNSLATTASWYSDAVANGQTDLQAGSFTITVGNGTPAQINVGNGSGINTLDDLATAINGMNLGVTANVVNDSNGSRLSIVSNSSGAANNFTITNDTTVGFTQAVTGQDASLTVDGIPIDSASNTVSGAVNGVTFNLLSASPGTEVDISVQPDTNSASTAISNFVSAYNTVVGDINSQYAVGANNLEGPLAGDSTLSLLQSDLLSAGGYTTGSGSVQTLADLGISMNKDGTLTLDQSQLDSAIQSNFGAVQTFLQGASSNGFVSFLNNQMNALTDASSGAFTVDLQSISNENQDLQNQINNFNTYLQQQEVLLTNEFNQANDLMQRLPAEEAQINAELGNQGNSTTIL